MRLVVRVATALALLGVLLVGLALIFAGPLCKAAIEKGGTWATGVETRIDSVSAGLVSGTLGLERLTIANPPGFGAAPFLELRHASAAWENRSILGDELHVEELALDGLVLRLERGDKGTNWGAILDHVEQRGAGKGAKEKPAEAPPGDARTLIVDRIVLTDLTAELTVAGLTKEPLRARVPRFELTGFRSDGSTTKVVGQLLAAIVEAALAAGVEAGSGIFPADVGREIEQRLGEVEGLLKSAGKRIEDAGKAFEGLFQGQPKGGKKGQKP